MTTSHEALGRAEELLERMRAQVDAIEGAGAAGGAADAIVDALAEIAELAKRVEAEIQRARRAAEAGS